MSLIDQVRRTLQREQLTTPATRVVVALSGGPDSTALAHVMRALHGCGELQFVALAHLNHQLRPVASADAEFCVRMAASLDRPITVEAADVGARAAAERRSVEDAAHAARYEFFARAAAAWRADVVAVGHTRDDQAETFLLRLLRGAGARGLASMYPRAGLVIRPLLDASRADVQAFLDQNGISSLHIRSTASTVAACRCSSRLGRSRLLTRSTPSVPVPRALRFVRVSAFRRTAARSGSSRTLRTARKSKTALT